MTRILMVLALVGAILVPGLSPIKVQLDESTRNEGLIAEIPFQLHGSFIVTEISVDESVPLNFIFDTGAGGTVINANTAAGLGIVGDETVSREGATGMAEIVRSTDHIVYVEDISFQDVTLGIAELGHIEKRIGTPIDGVIGWLILSQYAVRIDYDAMLIEIYDNNKFEYDFGDSGYTLEVQGTAIFTNVTVAFKSGNIFTGKVLVDTGAGNTFYFNTPFIEENDLLAEMDTYYERETQSISTESAHVYTTMLANLSISDYEFSTLPANIAIAEAGASSWSGPMGILGNGVLKRFNVFIDLQQKMMSLEPNRLYHDQFEVNCSGLELVTDDAFQRVIIDHVYSGSPAEEAGLEFGDEIVQINGANVSAFQLPQIRSMLSQNGEEIEILIDRKGELHNNLFILQPLME
ncbi:MAG: aspartyl protease family protein [Dehalococcoidia bacterium]